MRRKNSIESFSTELTAKRLVLDGAVLMPPQVSTADRLPRVIDGARSCCKAPERIWERSRCRACYQRESPATFAIALKTECGHQQVAVDDIDEARRSARSRSRNETGWLRMPHSPSSSATACHPARDDHGMRNSSQLGGGLAGSPRCSVMNRASSSWVRSSGWPLVIQKRLNVTSELGMPQRRCWPEYSR